MSVSVCMSSVQVGHSGWGDKPFSSGSPEFSLLGRLLGRGVFSGVQTVKRVCTVWLKEQLPIREPELLRGRTIVAME